MGFVAQRQTGVQDFMHGHQKFICLQLHLPEANAREQQATLYGLDTLGLFVISAIEQ